MVTLARRAQRIPFAPVAAAMFAAAAAIIMAAMPAQLFEALIVAGGLPGLVAAATPPLGLTARLLAIVSAFLVVGAGLWAVLTPLERTLEARRRARTPWHDAGYDRAAPAAALGRRKPIFAPEELGAPLMSDEAIAVAPPIVEPAPDLEAPIPAEALAAPRVAPAAELIAPEAPHYPIDSAPDHSIQGLIRRLEEGLARRAGRDPDPEPPAAAPLPLSADWIIDDESIANDPETPRGAHRWLAAG